MLNLDKNIQLNTAQYSLLNFSYCMQNDITSQHLSLTKGPIIRTFNHKLKTFYHLPIWYSDPNAQNNCQYANKNPYTSFAHRKNTKF